MANIYQSSANHDTTDHDYPDAAADLVEAHGSGQVTGFQVSKNLHGSKDFKCFAHWVFDGGQWFSVDIWGGWGDRTPCDRPS